MEAISTEYLTEKLREFNSLEIKRSHVPQTLRTLRTEIHNDDWHKTSQINDQDVLIEGIFDFLSIFKHLFDSPESRLDHQRSLSSS